MSKFAIYVRDGRTANPGYLCEDGTVSPDRCAAQWFDTFDAARAAIDDSGIQPSDHAIPGMRTAYVCHAY